MIRQGLAFDGILEKKFKILRTSIMLGNLKNRESTLSEYEDTAKELDRIKKNIYEELLASKMYTTVTLEDEESRLKDLIAFIENRIKERNDFVDDYIKITSNFLDGLDKVSLENELDSYKIRYADIQEYLNNCEEIKVLNIKLKELRDELEEKYENKANNELINSKLEEEMIDEFNKFISNDKYYSQLNYTDIDFELTNLEESILEKKSVLDTFTSSYQALLSAGITGAEREEYSSYVQDARLNYYEDVEKKNILNIYKLVLDKQVDYEKLYEKRTSINSLLEERLRVRESLSVTNRDELKYFYELCKEQFSIIKAQKYNMETIDKLILEISDCENKLSLLEKANNREGIVELLKEFSVEAVEIEQVELPDEKKVFEEVEKTIPKKPANMVVRIKDPIKINVKSVSDTAKLVMKKVVIVLEPKKFNSKRDKLKEAELELKREKLGLDNKIEDNKEIDNEIIDEVKNEDLLVEDNINLEEEKEEIKEDNDVFNDIFPEEIEKDDKVEESIFEEEKDEIFDDVTDNLDNNQIFEDNDNSFGIFDDGIIKFGEEAKNREVNTNDIFLDDDLGINLDTRAVFDDRNVKETKELTEIKITASDPSNMSIPTEIFIEDAPEPDPVDLFKATDPFLDDNQFELDSNKVNDEIKGNMPTIGSIGSVKPNSALSNIEKVVNSSSDVVLPNLGLVDNAKTSVPIVGENYIN